MPQPPNPQIVKKVKKLSEIAEELRQGKDFPVTRLTTIKSLCGEPEAAAAFALFLAQRIQSKMRQEESPERYRELVDRAVKELKPYLTDPTEERKARLSSLCREICTFPENTEPAATGQGVVTADFSTPTGERPSRARRGSLR